MLKENRESKNKRRLLTYRGLYGRDQQLNVTDSPKFQIESLKNNALVRIILTDFVLNSIHIAIYKSIIYNSEID